MKKGNRNTETMTFTLGDLVVALFDETKKVSSDRLEQNVLVYAALKDILKRRVKVEQKVALSA